MKNREIFEKNKKSVILLDLVIPEGKKQKISIRGTGFVVSKDGKFITCSHVYNKVPENERQYLGAAVPTGVDEKGLTHYKRYNIKLLDLDKENDVALMKILSNKRIDFEVVNDFGNSDSIKEGDEVIFLGYPLALELITMGFGITLSLNQCIISSVKKRGLDGSLHFFMVDTHINNGSSGSPLFSKKTGEIIGMASGKISTKIPLSRVKEMGEINKIKEIDVPANMGICRPAKYITHLIEEAKEN